MMFVAKVKILNISMGGAAIEADKRLNINREYILKIEYNGKVIPLRGIIVWSIISGSKKGPGGEIIPTYKAGMKFTNVLTDTTAGLLEFIEKYKKGEENRLSGVRFNIDVPPKAVLNYPFNYTVKKISLGGMLIESEQTLNVGDRFPMEIFLPENRSIKFFGRVASSIEVDTGGQKHYDIGIAFEEMSEEHKKILAEFIQTLYE